MALLISLSEYVLQAKFAKRTSQISATASVCPPPNLEGLKISGVDHFVQFDTETNLGHGIIGPDEPEGADGEDKLWCVWIGKPAD